MEQISKQEFLAEFNKIYADPQKYLVKNGKVDMQALRTLRMTLDDLNGALRQKDVFDIKEVSYAIFETNGKLSVKLKNQKKEKKKK